MLLLVRFFCFLMVNYPDMMVPGAVSAKNGVLDRPPSVATVQTLSLMAIYEGLCSGENSIESTWVLFGFATKLSQSVCHSFDILDAILLIT